MPAETETAASLTALANIEEGALFRLLFNAYADSLLLVDSAGKIVKANPSAAKLLGYPLAELVGLDVDTLVPDAIRPRHAAYRHAYALAPRPRPMGTQMELVAKRKDGSEVMVEIALSPLQSEGVPIVVAAVRDIGTYPRVKRALQRARYSEHLAQLGRIAVDARDPNELLDHVPAMAAEALQAEVARVFLVEPGGDSFRIVGGFGLVPGEGVGDCVGSGPDTLPGFVLSTGQPITIADYRTETRFVVPQALLDMALISAVAVPISDRGRLIGALVVRSTVVQRFGDDEVQFLESLANLLASSLQRAQTEEALRHAQRLESVGQLTGGIAHDFNNLLTVIQGNLQVLEELPAIAGDAYGQQLVGAASRATRRAAELTSKLLAFSRRQILQPGPVDVGALLQSLADMLRRTLDQHIRIEVDAALDRPFVLADPNQLESALLNIAINARDAMPAGGVLRFSAAARDQIPASIRDTAGQAARADDGFVLISVSDTGGGMSDEVKERAFEPFFTTKEVGRGTGLGLSAVYGFAKQSSGAVSIDSTLGEGSTLSLYLPRIRATPDASAANGAAMSLPGFVREGLRVLLVEDEPEVRTIIGRFLEAMHCDVTAAASAEEALPLLAADGRLDLLVTDIALGAGMRGTELAKLAQDRSPGIAVMLMSGFSAELLDADRESPSDWELLPKPCSREELVRAVARVMVSRS
jgi:PAS domain S-box-containing protein